MIQVQGKIPRKVSLALSGGMDSMVCYHFLKKNHDVRGVFVHHGTEDSGRAYQKICRMISEGHDIKVHSIDTRKPVGLSWEEHWRNERYKVFATYNPIITCHHLDDCVENWVWTSMHGNPTIIPYTNGLTVFRPFMLNTKNEFWKYLHRNRVSFVPDRSNDDTRFMRNYIRHEVMPHVLRLNPGIQKVIRKKVIEQGHKGG